MSPKTPESYTYDADGNLTERRALDLQMGCGKSASEHDEPDERPIGSKMQLVFAYDYMGRRIQKLVAAYSGSAYTNAYTNRFRL